MPKPQKHSSIGKQSKTQQNGTGSQWSMSMQCFPVRILSMKQQCGQISVSFPWPSCYTQRLSVTSQWAGSLKALHTLEQVSVQQSTWRGELHRGASRTDLFRLFSTQRAGGWVTTSKAKGCDGGRRPSGKRGAIWEAFMLACCSFIIVLPLFLSLLLLYRHYSSRCYCDHFSPLPTLPSRLL